MIEIKEMLLVKKKKIVLIVALIAIVSLIIFTISIVTFNNKFNEDNKKIYQEKTIEKIKLKIKDIEYINDFSNIYLEVNNISDEVINLDKIKIIFVDKDNNTIAEIYSYDNGNLDVNNELLLSLSIDKNITVAYDVKYELGSGNNE